MKWIKWLFKKRKPLRHHLDDIEGCHRQYSLDDNCFAYAIGNRLDLTREQIEKMEALNAKIGNKPSSVIGLLSSAGHLGYIKQFGTATEPTSFPCVAVIKGS